MSMALSSLSRRQRPHSQDYLLALLLLPWLPMVGTDGVRSYFTINVLVTVRSRFMILSICEMAALKLFLPRGIIFTDTVHVSHGYLRRWKDPSSSSRPRVSTTTTYDVFQGAELLFFDFHPTTILAISATASCTSLLEQQTARCGAEDWIC
ncbi:hypothetical protein BJ878DRAFT_237155 [Calycina marina]|uniref:Uncharacterized protein n=1 Tax=Calycina marina TaxID=1763456 RepID=A0A9P7ZBJ3_9HELO|nr:hypothetical protein BJ878DRAFT_237155 [Calycina marina]